MVPLLVPKLRPDGRPGVIDHVSTSPPFADGVAAFIAVPLFKVKGLPE